MTLNINSFRNGFKGTRPNRFEIVGTIPTAATGIGQGSPQGGDTVFKVYCKATQLPGSSVGLIPVAWQGRVVKFSGERTYQDWSIQIYDSNLNDRDRNLRDIFEKWINRMNHRTAHTINYDLTANWVVKHVDMESGQTHSDSHGDSATTGQQGHTREISLVNCFPIDLSPIDLSYDLTDTFSEFTVTMAYDYWTYGEEIGRP